jgi:hypothetical protein
LVYNAALLIAIASMPRTTSADPDRPKYRQYYCAASEKNNADKIVPASEGNQHFRIHIAQSRQLTVPHGFKKDVMIQIFTGDTLVFSHEAKTTTG